MKYDSTKDTLKHMAMVHEFGVRLSNDLSRRLITHDKSKLENPEKDIFDKYTPKLKIKLMEVMSIKNL